MDEDQLIVWQDVLDEILAQRTDNLACPLCGNRPLEVTTEDSRTKVSCHRCGKFIEGRFGGF